MLSDIRAAFAAESEEILAAMEEAILALERGDQGAIDKLFRAVHTLKGSSGIVGLAALERYAHKLETRLGTIRSGQKLPSQEAYGALLACKDRCAAILALPNAYMDEGQAERAVPPEDKLDDASLERLDAALVEARDDADTSPGLGASAMPIDDAEQEPEAAADSGSPRKAHQPGVRVPDAKLDALVNLVGEMVTMQAQLTRISAESANHELQSVGEGIRRLVGELRSAAMELRLVTADTLFSRFSRPVRDMAKALGKKVSLVTDGGSTELDKSIVDGLAEPLLHLVRNAVDHGTETPDERERLGKPRSGTVRVSASHEGASVRIMVEDDGPGIDTARILDKARELGLAAREARLSREDILQFMFQPGFSTAQTVSTVSGRGFGLDIVKSAVERLGGSLSVDTEQGRGTRFFIDLPLTIAIIDGFLAELEGRLFVLPLANVAECWERPRPDPAARERLLERRGELVPELDLERFFGLVRKSAPGPSQAMVLAVAYGKRLALAFDALIGGYQTVIKPLGELASHLPGVSGAAILPNGTVALILDVAGLARANKETATAKAG
ncbi:MAG: chemotaxis protein CheA [Spirochaetia bacterium]|nr:chemotaxis protein CheA [Spirochaetia bacterium]